MDDMVFLSLGSNIGNRENHFRRARALLEERGVTVLKRSSLYSTEPYGKRDQDWFLNQIVGAKTRLAPFELLETVKEIERRMGRKDCKRWDPRIIDIDIIFYGNRTVDSPSLTIPHEETVLRKFVLVPLNEIAPRFIHPERGKPVSELLEECGDDSEVTKVE